jgi:electron transfer flavoprotein alpha subunit
MSESLKGDLVAIVLGDNVGQAHEQVIPYGTDNVYVANDETLQNFRLE